MFISRNWLKDFVKIPDSLSAKELGLKMTMAMAEVEGFVDQKEKLQGVVIGEILEVSKHPNADKLQLTLVDIGNEKLKIVCGAPNIAKGQKVPVATIGTKLPSGLTISLAKVRGEESQGMLCAEDELGLGKDHSGILILDSKLKVGEPLARALKLDDVIYEIENKSITHRPDLWSCYGVAREVAAILGEKLKAYQPKIKAGSENLNIKIEDFNLCPRYMGVVVEGIKIAESPDWLKQRLEAVGMRAINNIVDITNYVMLEIGQPLHAFDHNKLEGQRIIVRNAKPGEKIKTLDDADRELTENILVIADAKKPVAIAGVMGGANTEIDEQTEKIIIESANFNHVSIRKTSTQLGLRTEASIRFEKSLDPNITELGIKKAVELIQQLCPEAKVISQIEDINKFELSQGPIIISFDFIRRRIGQDLDKSKIISILERLGFTVKKTKDDLEIVIPTWRATKDISIAEDIIEETARIYGYDNLQVTMPLVAMERPVSNLQRELEHRIKGILANGLAMTEVSNYSFVSQAQINNLGLDLNLYIKVANPLSPETQFLRRELIVHLLNNLQQNNRYFDDIRIFEIGSVYLQEIKGDRISDKEEKNLPAQPIHLCGLISEKNESNPFYAAKNIAEALLKQLRFSYKLEKSKMVTEWAYLNRSLKIMIDDKIVGLITELNPKLYSKLEIKNKVGIFVLNLNDLTSEYRDEMLYQPIPKFPSIELDVSLIIDKKILWEEVKQTVLAVEKDLIKQLKIFDVYEGKNIPAGKKSIAFRIEYQSADKTLTMEEVQIIHAQVLQQLEGKLSAQIRK